MNKNDNLGNRMKGYEYISRNYLTKRLPVIIRLDGKAFHTFTKGLKKPFDDILIETMQETAKYLCENIQGCKLAYTQSDEITLLLTDYDNIDTQGWFEYNIQKMCSISASMATLAFNEIYHEKVLNYIVRLGKGICKNDLKKNDIDLLRKEKEIYESKFNRALFDSRVFTLPKEEVCNCFIWRQQDAIRNSIQMVGQANFSHKELQNKSCNNIQDILFTQKGIDWNNYDTYLKRGSCVLKYKYLVDGKDNTKVQRTKWVIDKDIPIFKKDRNYIDRFVFNEYEQVERM